MLAQRYINTVEKNLNIILNQLDTIKKAAAMITKAVTGGNKIFVVDKYGIIESELVDRASGLALFRSLSYGRETLSEGDILLISSFHQDDEYDMNNLNMAHSLGASVISISPPGKLADTADIALSNNTDAQNGVITVSGIGRPFCPLSGVMNATLAWVLSAEITELLMAEGKIPTVYWGEYLADGKDKLIQARKRFSSLGY